MKHHGHVLGLGLLGLTASIAHADPHITIESDDDEVSLNQVTAEASASAYGAGGSAYSSAMSSRVVCRAPCDATLPSQYKYFIDGDGMPRSRKFLLPMEGDATITVDAGDNVLFGTGATFLALGGISTRAARSSVRSPETTRR